MAKRVLIVGGGSAGWITAAYLARMLSVDLPGGVALTLVESPEIGPIGVGEGTFPSILKTLGRIGLHEDVLFQQADATFKQGVRFVNWARGDDHYYHLFQPAKTPEGLDLLPYWLLGEAGNVPWSAVANVQSRTVEMHKAPKRLSKDGDARSLAYAYHFNAVVFAEVLKQHAIGMGVKHVADKVLSVQLSEDGAIDRVLTEKNGAMTADLYIDCSGFSALLIGKALGVPFSSCRHQLFVDRAVVVQQPYPDPRGPIRSCTYSTASRAGWIWDIGLRDRQGIGYVYSSNHCSDEEAVRTLQDYLGPAASQGEPRYIRFETGYRKLQWRKNCVAIGLSAGFMEPLEATGIGLVESAALLLAALFPWDGPYEPAAQQFNEKMSGRYANVADFIKLHYCLSQRRDSAFWTDNCDRQSIPDSLQARIESWRYRVPDFVDIDYGQDTFIEGNWRQVLYGMGFRTDLSARRGAYRHSQFAQEAFRNIERQAAQAMKILPSHRELVEEICGRGAGVVPRNSVAEGYV
ncbi:tryptophan halogenase family protein [Hydrocarboniphaga sp.]|uniref:tryptophan halogenase family protein n=1 Tax=Hydrocarboniphaga sp. TaxID=2033016 RepID=UPI003D0A8327